MNWDKQLNSIISAADGSVTKIRERLTQGKHSRGREDVFPVRDVSGMANLDPSCVAPVPQISPSLSPAVQFGDFASIQAQLQSQSQMIESLTQSLRLMERERNAQQRQILTLQEELRRLREQTEERERVWERERDLGRRGMSPGEERRMEQWKREVGRELSSLRDHINMATSLGNQEESFSSRLRREEVEHLRREVDQLKNQLMRQEEDMFQQQSETRETRRQYERNCKMLESLTDSYRTHSFDLARTISQYQTTQQEVRDLRMTVSELKDEVRGLILRDKHPTPVAVPKNSVPPPPTVTAVTKETTSRRKVLLESDSDDDFSPTPSLGEVSSDDLDTSWLAEGGPALRPRGNRHVRLNLGLTGSDISDAGSELGSTHDDDVGEVSDSPPDLSLSDL